MSTHTATVYLQVEPQWSSWKKVDGEPALDGAKVVAFTLKKPDRPRSGTVTVKLAIVIPAGAFLPLRPEAVVTIPESLTAASLPIEVEAVDPS